MSEYRILEDGEKSFKVQRDIGREVRSGDGWKSYWESEWVTISIEKTLEKAKKELRRLRVSAEGIIHED